MAKHGRPFLEKMLRTSGRFSGNHWRKGLEGNLGIPTERSGVSAKNAGDVDGNEGTSCEHEEFTGTNCRFGINLDFNSRDGEIHLQQVGACLQV